MLCVESPLRVAVPVVIPLPVKSPVPVCAVPVEPPIKRVGILVSSLVLRDEVRSENVSNFVGLTKGGEASQASPFCRFPCFIPGVQRHAAASSVKVGAKVFVLCVDERVSEEWVPVREVPLRAVVDNNEVPECVFDDVRVGNELYEESVWLEDVRVEDEVDEKVDERVELEYVELDRVEVASVENVDEWYELVSVEDRVEDDELCDELEDTMILDDLEEVVGLCVAAAVVGWTSTRDVASGARCAGEVCTSASA